MKVHEVAGEYEVGLMVFSTASSARFVSVAWRAAAASRSDATLATSAGR